MPAVALGIEHALGRAGRAGGRVGEHALHLALGAEQQPRRVVRQILVCRKGEGGESGKRVKMSGQIAVKAAPLFFTREQSVELFKLHRLNARSRNARHSLLATQKGVDPGKSHRYNASPF